MINQPSNTKFYSQIVDLLQSARDKVVRTVNQTMVLTYFEIGRMLVEEEQGEKERADYGKKVVKGLSKVLTKEFGKGFSERNIEQMRQFYLAYSKSQTLSAELITESVFKELNLSWSHYLKLMLINTNLNIKCRINKLNYFLFELGKKYKHSRSYGFIF